MKQKRLKCSFCFEDESVCARIVAGPGVFICDKCIQKFYDELQYEGLNSNFSEFQNKFPTPRDIFEFLDSYVIGQEQAKKVLSVATYNHYKRVYLSKNLESIVNKSNILLIGPTGSGKSYLVKTLAKCLQVPISLNDATSLTEAGYVGDDVESVLSNLFIASNYNLEEAERGICFIDEIDKIARKQDSSSVTRDVSGEGVQQALLKIVEDTKANILPRPGRKHPQQDYIQMRTRDILFIVAGVFEGIDKIIDERAGRKSIGFNSSLSENNLYEVNTEDLIKFGMIPEFLGRFPIICQLSPLSESDLVRILEEPKDALLKQYKIIFESEGVELIWEKEALVEIAKKAILNNTGARGLRGIVEEIFRDIFFECNFDVIQKVILTKNAVLSGCPEIIFKRKVAYSK